MSHEEHKAKAHKTVNFAIVTISSSRKLENDESGNLIKRILERHNHKVISHTVVPDDADAIKEHVKDLINKEDVEAIITNGGTGLAKEDLTIEAIRPLFEKELIGFNSLLAQLSYESIGPSTILSRATAGTINKKVIFCLPGSPKACGLAVGEIIVQEAGHIVKHLSD